MSAFPKTKSLGFSLIELMITVVIVAILTAVALPNFQTWLLNSQIRNAAESISNGMQRARAEAVARNANVAFVLGTGAGSASSWTVDYVVPPVPPPAGPIDSRLSNEGSKDVTRTVLPANATTVTFNNFGGVVANADATASLAEVDLAAVGGSPLRVTIGVGGNAKMCDPNMPVSIPPSPRAC